MVNQPQLVQEPDESKRLRLQALEIELLDLEREEKHYQRELKGVRQWQKDVRGQIRVLAQELAEGQQTLAVVEDEPGV